MTTKTTKPNKASKTATVKTRKAAPRLPARDEVGDYEDHASKYMRAWLEKNAPAEIRELWQAHIELIDYMLMEENVAFPKTEQSEAMCAARDIDIILRVAGPLPPSVESRATLGRVLNSWGALTENEQLNIVKMISDATGVPLPAGIAGA